ncbi:mediator of RNA polymerase II transcription subunit 15-like [Argopecten irradians]|uniref:mediator of RNA polymerase II transcription subunit 15-like n=1 Tax=Argopecten irradians TaxID=31199 RepID=UPI003710DFC4
MNRNQRNFNHRGNRGGDRDGRMNFNRKGLLGEPPGMGGMNGPQMGGGLGILGSAPGQGMPGGNISGPLGGMNQNNMFGGMGGGIGQQMGMAQGRGGMDQSHNQNDMSRGGQGGMNQGNQGMMGMQQQMAAAAMRDSQLQLVSNLIQQQGGMSSPMMGGPNQGGMMSGGQGMGGGGAGLLGMGGMGMNEMGRSNERRNSGGNNIPSLFDINTKKTGLLGKRGNTNNRERESRFSNHQNNNKRMRQNNQGVHHQEKTSQKNTILRRSFPQKRTTKLDMFQYSIWRVTSQDVLIPEGDCSE